MTTNLIAFRHKLRAAGYSPIPCEGKRPPMNGWDEKINATEDEIRIWSGLYPHATNTGVFTRLVPTIDIDILDPEAAQAVEDLVSEMHAEHGNILVRFGLRPKRAIPFRTDEPFKKITANLVAPDGSEGQKIELLADGQQFIVSGIHPDTRKPYGWFGGELDETPREELPYIREADAIALVEAIVELLIRDFGYRRAEERPKNRAKANGHDAGGVADWAYLLNAIHTGRDWHESTNVLGAKLIASGMGVGAAINLVRAALDNSQAPHDERWQARRDDIARSIENLPQRTNGKIAPTVKLRELEAMAFDPVRFLVRNLIPREGVCLICAKPKSGKSWLVLDLALACAMDRYTLGDIKPLQGSVLYLALEDGHRRLRSRVDKLLPSAKPGSWLGEITFATEWKRVDQGGLDDIRSWVMAERGAGRSVAFVAVDVLKYVRPATVRGKAAYESDYEAIIGLQKLARELSIAILVVHHTRKAESDDLIDKVSGTFGLTGAADTVFVLEKKSNGWIFDVRGRDVLADELAAEFNKDTCRWTILGNAGDLHRSRERDLILSVFREAQRLTPKPVLLSPKDVTEALVTVTEGPVTPKTDKVRQNMARMARVGLLKREEKGKYSLPQIPLSQCHVEEERENERRIA
jgi:hypothetical protein